MTPEFAAALIAAQAEMPALQRDKINPAFRSRYLSLEALLAEVLPVLNRHGLALAQFPTYVETETGLEPALRTVLVHKSGDSIEDTMLMLAAKREPQPQGSAITYAKRYSLMALLGLSADEDDDGNAAQPRQRQRAAATGSATTVGVASDAQLRRLRAIQRERGITDDRLRELVREHAGVESSRQIPRAKYGALVAAVEKEGSVAA